MMSYQSNRELSCVNQSQASQPDSNKVQSHFDERAASYSDLFDDSVRTGAGHKFRCRRDIIKRLLIGQSGRLLECATGTGEITAAALQVANFNSALINDYSSEMLERSKNLINFARERNPIIVTDIEFSQASVYDLFEEVPAGSIDVMLSLGLVAHVGELDKMMKLAQQLISDNGRFLFQTSLLDSLGTRLIKRFSEKRHLKQKGYAINHYWDVEVLEAARNNGLKIESYDRYGFDVPFLDRVAPSFSFFLEEKLKSRSATKGSEAVYVVTKIQTT